MRLCSLCSELVTLGVLHAFAADFQCCNLSTSTMFLLHLAMVANFKLLYGRSHTG